jgi:hypothetical protein
MKPLRSGGGQTVGAIHRFNRYMTLMVEQRYSSFRLVALSSTISIIAMIRGQILSRCSFSVPLADRSNTREIPNGALLEPKSVRDPGDS